MSHIFDQWLADNGYPADGPNTAELFAKFLAEKTGNPIMVSEVVTEEVDGKLVQRQVPIGFEIPKEDA